jgi:K+ transporter
MSELPTETRALRQRLMAGVLGFILGLVALLGGVRYVVFIMIAREQGWGGAIHIGVHLTI